MRVMLDFLCSIVARIVFSGIDGTILIIPLLLLLKAIWGQARETMELFKEV